MSEPLLDAVSFTAGREWDDGSAGVAQNMLALIPAARRYFTGGCRGGDAYLGRYLYLRYPRAEHYVIVPANRSQVDPWWEDYLPWHPGLTAIGRLEMWPGTSYADRNARLVANGTVMYGLPAWPEDDPRSLRSGTWQTIRMAREAGKLISWSCVQPPYLGRIEGNINDFLTGAAR